MLADPLENGLVNQVFINPLVLVGVALPCGGLFVYAEGTAAELTAVAAGAGSALPEAVVVLRMDAYVATVVRALRR